MSRKPLQQSSATLLQKVEQRLQKFWRNQSNNQSSLVHRQHARPFEQLEQRIVLSSTPLITEFMASNASTLEDGDGNYSDWIEVHNPTSQLIDLNGWFLTDNAATLDKWAFPNISIQPNEYLVVFASAPDDGAGGVLNNYVDAGGHLHTNFSLSANGEYLGLTTDDGLGGHTIVHEYGPEYPTQDVDVSYGVDQDINSLTLISADTSVATAIVPSNGALDAPSPGQAPPWTLPAFDDSSWHTSAPGGGTGVGFDVGDDEDDDDGGSGDSGPSPNAIFLPSGLIGNDLTDPEEDGSLAGTISVGNPNSPGGEEPPKALDGDNGTKWLSFSPTGTYYQFEFSGGPEAVKSYTITSANDAPRRDPYSWTLSGSNDGTNFTVLDTRTAQDFASRFQTILFEFANETSYDYYRFDFQTEFGATGGNPTGELQLAEIELFDEYFSNDSVLLAGLIGNDLTDPEEDGSLAGTYSVGNPNSPAGEEPAKALDNTAATKWLAFTGTGTYYQFQFDAGPQLVNAYTITSANDHPERDPYSWTLSGSNDGTNFAVIDARDAQDFATRFETQWFEFNNSTAYEYYRFDFLTEFGATGNNSTSTIQMAEIELFDVGPIDFAEYIDIDIESDWNTHQTGIYQRIDFNVTNPATLSSLLLNMQYDDGFAAYINGHLVAQAAAPITKYYDASATSKRTNGDSISPVAFDITAHLDKLVAGTNVLAIHGLNVDDLSEDLLLRSELLATEVVDPNFTTGFYSTPTPGEINAEGLLGFVEEPSFSVERGFYDSSFQLQISNSTPGADIYYTTNGDVPTSATGTLYTGAFTVDSTSTIRAAAIKADHIDSDAATHTYIFVNDVVSQSHSSTLSAGFPTSWGPFSANYGMDPDVIGNFDANGNSLGGDLYGGIYAATIKDDLKAIPTLSIVMDIDDMFGPNGVYTNSTLGGVAWERATSVELINPDGSEGFQIDAGIRAQGGAFRRDDLSKKHSLRLLFKSQYGSSKLNYPFFGDDATDQFDTITLRMDSNDGYAWSGAGNDAQYARDEFGRRTQLDLGQNGSHGNRMHLYINGVYWGLYNPVERPDGSFSANYYGGDKSEWDAINDNSPVDGDLTTWNTLNSLAQAVDNASTESARTAAYMFLQGLNPDGTNNSAAENYLDVDNYIDYMLVNLYGGNVDWPHRNWFASRQRGPDSTGFKFHIWDLETALNLGSSNVNTDRTGVSSEVAAPYDNLRASEEFRIRFADRAHRALFNDGALTTQNTIDRYSEIIAEINEAIVAESARWGDMHSSTPHTKSQWQSEANSVINSFLANRTPILLNQLRNAGLYSTVDAAVFNQHGGQVAAGFDAVLTNSNGSGTIYYTLDGTDPRLIGGALSGSAIAYSGAINIGAGTTIRTRILSGGEWSALDEATFTVAQLADTSNLRITELNYNPHDANLQPGFGELDVNNDDFEFIELQNVGNETIDLAGVQFVEASVGSENEGMTFTFGQQTLAPGEFILVVEDQTAFESRYGLGLNIAGEYSGRLANGGETLTLLAANDSVIQQFAYNDSWESRTDGVGSSLEVISTDGDYDSESNWRASIAFGGTPGAAAIETVDVIVNEVLAHTDLPEVDAIELYNSSGASVDLSGWWLSDTSSDFFKYQITATSLAADNYVVFDENDFNSSGGVNPSDFALSAGGDSVWLIETDGSGKPTRFADVVKFDASLNGTTLGRVPNGNSNSELFPQATNTLGGTNSSPAVGSLIFSEVHYHPAEPPLGNTITESQLEFVEIYNRSGQTITLHDGALGGWKLSGGVDFDFSTLPIGTSIAAEEVMVLVSFDPTNTTLANEFRNIHSIAGSVPLVGPYDGQLSNAGEQIELLAPTAPPLGSTEPVHYLIDRVNFDDMAPWPTTPDGGGQSLNRTQQNTFGDAAASWQAATPTPGNATFAPPTPGDFDNDGSVDGVDLAIWETGYGTSTGATSSDGDADGDNDVDGFDFLTWQRNFTPPPIAASAASGNLDNDSDTEDTGENSSVILAEAVQSQEDANNDQDVDAPQDSLAWQHTTHEAAPLLASVVASDAFAVSSDTEIPTNPLGGLPAPQTFAEHSTQPIKYVHISVNAGNAQARYRSETIEDTAKDRAFEINSSLPPATTDPLARELAKKWKHRPLNDESFDDLLTGL